MQLKRLNRCNRWNLSDSLSKFQLQGSNLLDCPQICLSLLCWVSVRQETIISSIGGLVHKFLFFLNVNSEDLFPLPALTHCDFSTVRSPVKRRRRKKSCEHKSTQSCTWFKVNLADSINLLFMCNWGETHSGFLPGKLIQGPSFGTHTCLSL